MDNMKQQSELRRAKEAEEHVKFQKAAAGTALSRSQYEDMHVLRLGLQGTGIYMVSSDLR